VSQSWKHEKQAIEERLKAGKVAPSVPSQLALSELQVIPDVFQHRSGNEAASSKHIDGLVKSLRGSKGKPFEPLTVYWIGDAWVVIDGHHRYEAYTFLDYAEPVPVQVFEGSLDEAIGEALNGNSRDKLPFGGSREKSNAAWRIVVGTGLSISKAVAVSNRSRQTIITMRTVAKEISKKHPERDLCTLTWDDAQRISKGLKPLENIDDDWQEKRAKELADRLVRTFATSLGKQPEVFWRALEIYDGRLVECFMEMHGIDPETDEEFLEGDRDF
jgi:hypothetical protein